MTEQQENYNEKTSKYNEAMLQITRLHESWIKAEEYANTNSLMKWKFILDSIWRELFPDIFKNDKKEKWLKDNKEIKDKIIKSNHSTELYHYLDLRHQFLKYIQDSVGKGGVYAYVDDESAEY